MLQYFETGFDLKWKAFDVLDKMRYTLWAVALLEACDVTKHIRRLSRLLGFYLEFKIS